MIDFSGIHLDFMQISFISHVFVKYWNHIENMFSMIYMAKEYSIQQINYKTI